MASEINDINGKDRPCINCRWYMQPYHCCFWGDSTRETDTCSMWEKPLRGGQSERL